MSFKIRYLVVAIAATYPFAHANAAGMDRTGQDIKAFFNEGVYAEMDYVHISTKISGHDNAENHGISIPKDYTAGKSTGNITPHDYNFVRYGVKADVTDNISVGVFYDKPWGAKVEITGDNAFVTSKDGSETTNTGSDLLPTVSNNTINPSATASNTDYNRNTHVEVDSQSLTGIVGYKLGDIQVYGGPVIQKVHADLSLRGKAYGPITGYDAVVNEDTAMGWLAGVSYSKPEIMLNAALTYRSAIQHDAPVAETIPVLGSTLKAAVAQKIQKNTGEDVSNLTPNVTTNAKVTTPESVNLNLQTGLSRKHQLMGFVNARWVPWSKFKIVPPAYNVVSKANTPEGLPLLNYDKDGWQVEVGLGKRVNERLAVSGVVGWDSGAGDPVSSLGPVNGYWSVGGGARYNLTPEWSVSAGGKYMKFGDAKAKLPNGAVVGKFGDNDGYVVGVKLAYHQR